MNGDGEPPPGSGWFLKWAYKYDLVPPSAPTMVQASAVEGGLHLSWAPPDPALDLQRYAFLCDPPLQADPAGGLGPNELCESPRLDAGEILDRDRLSRFWCGDTGADATSADLVPLTSDVAYAVGVLALDDYHNPSPLSETACDVPRAPLEFDNSHTVFTQRGCAIGVRREGSPGALLLAAGILARARRRRRWSQSRRAHRWDRPDGRIPELERVLSSNATDAT